ncbi:MAG TPA: phospho-N-acetylmuramoyl-pentapeptide-transferase [Blastocatellia bacterium]|nr:phospho-N-acetylmuramoyl-pentapeptide-transferase [Blastocatellia bacterium]
MFYYLHDFNLVHESLSWLRVFEYITFRTAQSALTALVISLFFGGKLIRKLQEFQIGQQIREEGPRSHQAKRGTPTMGGVLIVMSVVVATLLWSNLANPYVWIAIFSILAYGGIGFADDYRKLVRKQNLGLTGRQKLVLQFATALVIGIVLFKLTPYTSELQVPFISAVKWSPLQYWPLYVAFILFVIVGSSNAVNLTDGLDGLAISVTFITAASLTAFTYVTSHLEFSQYLGLVHNPQVGELTVFCGALAGASLGFLWFNAPPAEVFMGDVGSLAIGGAIGTVAVIVKQEFTLVLIGGVFVIEALSVMIQVTTFRLFNKRLFKMSPIHHHFELIGWKESKIVFRFMIVAIIFALLSLSTLKLR